ncbi:adenylate/guanylate cyclase domain-containing protein [Marinicauda salina]|nr:adenylate/guanylate cyclase domain-containing protein [Marinicauda salina]
MPDSASPPAGAERGDLALRAAQACETPLAVADPESFEITLENARFFQLFASSGKETETLADRVPGFDADAARRRLEGGRPFKQELEVKSGPRTLHFQMNLRREEGDGAPFVLAEFKDLSKQREAEYMLDSYSAMAERNARELKREKERVEKLLLNIMPRQVYEELREYGTTTPQKFESASVLMLDFVDFTEMAVSQDPAAVISELNDIFSAFDRIVELFDCERIKTIGDAYVAVSGLPHPNPDHATALARVALRMKRFLEKRNASHPNTWRFRIGLASGPLIGSMVGIQKYVYDVFGPAANLAARVEDACEAGEIAISDSFNTLIAGRFATSEIGEFDLKGFGPTTLHRLDYEAPQ